MLRGGSIHFCCAAAFIAPVVWLLQSHATGATTHPPEGGEVVVACRLFRRPPEGGGDERVLTSRGVCGCICACVCSEACFGMPCSVPVLSAGWLASSRSLRRGLRCVATSPPSETTLPTSMHTTHWNYCPVPFACFKAWQQQRQEKNSRIQFSHGSSSPLSLSPSPSPANLSPPIHPPSARR